MVTYLDTAKTGNLVQGQSLAYTMNGQKFWLNVVNNIISGQATGQTVIVTVVSRRGNEEVSVPYGTTTNVPCRGYLVRTTLLASPNANFRLLISDEEMKLTVQTVSAGTVTVSGTVAVSSVSGTVTTDIGSAGTYARLALAFAGGSSPATGVWTVDIKATTDTININNNPVVTGALAGETYTVRYAVTGGQAYTVTGGTILDGSVSQN